MLRSRAAWTAGAVLTLAHSIAAFGVFYGWSHDTARIMTARQTLEATGFPFDGGIYVNYAFVAVWLADAAWWWASPRSYTTRPKPISWAVRGFIFFIIFNGSVVFADGWARVIGTVAVGLVIAASVWRMLNAGASHPATGSQHS